MLTNYNTSLVYIYGYRHEVDSRINNSIISFSLNPTFLSHPPRQNSTNPFQEISVCLSFLVTPILDKYYSSLSKNTFDINYQGGARERSSASEQYKFLVPRKLFLVGCFLFFLDNANRMEMEIWGGVRICTIWRNRAINNIHGSCQYLQA